MSMTQTLDYIQNEVDYIVRENDRLRRAAVSLENRNKCLLNALCKSRLESIELLDEIAKLRGEITGLEKRLARYKAVVKTLSVGDVQGANTTVFWMA